MAGMTAYVGGGMDNKNAVFVLLSKQPRWIGRDTLIENYSIQTKGHQASTPCYLYFAQFRRQPN
jgi:hypothetical protein